MGMYSENWWRIGMSILSHASCWRCIPAVVVTAYEILLLAARREIIYGITFIQLRRRSRRAQQPSNSFYNCNSLLIASLTNIYGYYVLLTVISTVTIIIFKKSWIRQHCIRKLSYFDNSISGRHGDRSSVTNTLAPANRLFIHPGIFRCVSIETANLS
jgi:hypothetical protein